MALSPMISTFLILSSLLALLSTPPPTLADESNVLLTGETIPTDGQLSYSDSSFVMQGDCNLVLYNKASGFQSDTSGHGSNCTATLDDFGRLRITNSGGFTVWTIGLTAYAKNGKYAAVLGPDGQVKVYGPTLWSSEPQYSPAIAPVAAAAANTFNLAAEEVASAIPIVKNVLFSSQILNVNDALATRDYTFVMQDDCNLVLIKAGHGVLWQSGTSGRGNRCFARLSHRGALVVQDDFQRIIWRSQPIGADGDYVLILQIDGVAAIYGTSGWSTSSP